MQYCCPHGTASVRGSSAMLAKPLDVGQTLAKEMQMLREVH